MWTAKTDQTGCMPRLIGVFAGHTDHFVGFVMRRLKHILTTIIKRRLFYGCVLLSEIT